MVEYANELERAEDELERAEDELKQAKARVEKLRYIKELQDAFDTKEAIHLTRIQELTMRVLQFESCGEATDEDLLAAYRGRKTSDIVALDTAGIQARRRVYALGFAHGQNSVRKL